MIEIGVIGGSGIYDLAELHGAREVPVDTPFGAPSDAIVVGTVHGRNVGFLARHGRNHRLSPSDLPFRANIYALKKLGARKILSASAVGSLKEEIAPLDLVVPDQFFDRTRGRVSTFFGPGLVAHVAFADPVCPRLGDALDAAARAAGATVHRGGTYVCMEGPQFSTRAESHTYRRMIHGATVIGMTNLQEAKLAREAEMCYATLALVTDYDCWHEEEEDVTTAAVVEILRRNAEMARAVMTRVIRDLDLEPVCPCERALDGAILTPRSAIDPAARERLEPILARVLG